MVPIFVTIIKKEMKLCHLSLYLFFIYSHISVSDIPQMFAKIQQFFTLSFFLKIAFPIQAYFLEISHTFWSCTFNESF